MSSSNQSFPTSRILVESALMVAVATVLSLFKLIELPYGGSVTIGCMLPVILISYRHGLKWGVLAGTVFAVVQQLLGIGMLSYVTTWQSILAVILLDYIVAYMVTGIGGIFRRIPDQPAALVFGTLLVCILRYLCHVISGATVWAGLSIPTQAALLFSVGYNATYMIPETIVTIVLAYYIGSVIDFRDEQIMPFKKSEASSAVILRWIGGLILAIAVIVDAMLVFSNLQNGETGEFDITGLSQVSWPLLCVITGAGLVLFIILQFVGRREKH